LTERLVEGARAPGPAAVGAHGEPVEASAGPAPGRARALWQVALAAASWGTWSLFLRPAGLPATFTSPLVMLLIGVFALPLALRERTTPRWDRRTAALLAANAALDALNVATFFGAMSLTTNAVAVLTHYFTPVLVALAAPYVDRQRVPGAVPAAVAAAVGLALVLEPWRAGEDGGVLFGGLLGTISAFAYAGNVFVIRRLAVRIGPARAQSYHSLLAGLLLVPVALLGERPTPTALGLGLLVLGALGPGTVAGYAFVRGLPVVGAARASVFTYLEPLVAVLVGALVWHEPLGALALLGGALVVAAGVAVTRGGDDAQAEDAHAAGAAPAATPARARQKASVSIDAPGSVKSSRTMSAPRSAR
jgi:drug/metabolite transporter (DMT)-like permease